jgi:hypothetical protein
MVQIIKLLVETGNKDSKQSHDITQGNGDKGQPAENGVLSVTAFMKDVAGNTTSVSASDTAKLDTIAPNTGTAPTVEILSDVNNDGTIDWAEVGAGDVVFVKVSFVAGSAAVGDKLIVSSGVTTDTYTLTADQISAGYVTAAFEKPAVGETFTATAWMEDAPLNTTTEGTDSATVSAVSTVLTLHGTTAYNLHAVAANIGTLTEVDMVADAGVNTVKLSLSDVLGVAKVGAIPTLKLTGSATDFAEVGLANWTDSHTTVTSNGHTYEVFNAKGSDQAQLLIDQLMWNANHVI